MFMTYSKFSINFSFIYFLKIKTYLLDTHIYYLYIYILYTINLRYLLIVYNILRLIQSDFTDNI